MATTAELLALVESAIAYKLGRIAAGDYLKMSIGDRSIEDYSLKELFELRAALKGEDALADGDPGFRLSKIQYGDAR